MTDASLVRAEISSANLSGAILSGTTMPDGEIFR
ncbi:MAG: pentapeptide repeat-containing protein [Leptolyngbyaceae bacterium]|nr:pentapeptide repeat-containing protein [Leptolyngbyaceae bacterium]